MPAAAQGDAAVVGLAHPQSAPEQRALRRRGRATQRAGGGREGAGGRGTSASAQQRHHQEAVTSRHQEAALGDDESVKEVKETSEGLYAKATKLQRRLHHLQSNFDPPPEHRTIPEQGRCARAAASSANRGQSLVNEEKRTNWNLKLNAALEKIPSSVREMAYYKAGEEERILLSFDPFRSFVEQDQPSTTVLNEGLMQLNVASSKFMVVEGHAGSSGDSVRTHETRLSEMQRMRSTFWVSERQWVEAHL